MREITFDEFYVGIEDVGEVFETFFAQRFMFECVWNEQTFFAKLVDCTGLDIYGVSHFFDRDNAATIDERAQMKFFAYDTLAEARAHCDQLMSEALEHYSA